MLLSSEACFTSLFMRLPYRSTRVVEGFDTVKLLGQVNNAMKILGQECKSVAVLLLSL